MHKIFTQKVTDFRYRYLSLLILLVFTATSCDVFKSDGSGKEEKQEEEKPSEEPNEEPTETVWYKGNLHAHSYWTDADDYPETILSWYKEHNYNFAVISGHNSIHEGGDDTVRVDTQRDEFYLQRYINQFGEEWVEEEGSVVSLKNYNEYSNKLTDDSFLAIRGQEIDYRDADNPNNNDDRLIHINAINVQEKINASEGGTTPAIIQETLEKVNTQASQHNVPMLATINHPNIRKTISADDLKQVEGARFFEVYNGHPNATNQGYGGEGGLHSTEEIWDEVLTHNLQNGKGLLYGVAADDSHGYNFDAGITPDANLPGRGWIQVKAEELTPAAIVNAMNDGKFYASTGVELADVTFKDGTLNVRVSRESGVSYTIQFIGTKSDQTNNPGVILKKKEGIEASYKLQENDLYVRAKVISDKEKPNASSQGEVEVAYVQPVTQ